MNARWRHLSIDIIPYECDPAFIQRLVDAGIHENMPGDVAATARFEHLARRVRDFTNSTREFLPVIWAHSLTHQEMQIMFPENRMIYEMEGKPHIVEWRPQDVLMPKTESSAHNEHIEEFDQMKREGVEGFTVSGVSLSACVLFSALPLLFGHFKVVILDDLTDDRRPENIQPARQRLAEAGAVFMNSADIIRTRGHVLDEILQRGPQIEPPRPL